MAAHVGERGGDDVVLVEVAEGQAALARGAVGQGADHRLDDPALAHRASCPARTWPPEA